MNNTCNLCPADMTMIRGDLFEYPLRFSLNEDTAYRLLDGDVLRFGVFRGRKPMLLLRYYSTQQAEDGTIKITIAPELTERMAPGDYRFEAELTSDINGIHTVAGGTFRLMEDRITPDVRNGVVKPPDYPDSELPDDHERLNGREKSDQHPIRAVTGLSKRLNDLRIVADAAGRSIVLNDASGERLCGLMLYGKTTQDGVPTPYIPIPLASAGDSGTITTVVAGKNLLAPRLTSGAFSGNADGTYTAVSTGAAAIGTVTLVAGEKFTLSATRVSGNGALPCLIIRKNDGTNLETNYADTTVPVTVALDETLTVNVILQGAAKNTACNVGDVFAVQFEVGEVPTDYEPYKGRFLTVQISKGLPGIPVLSDGNYTDPNGQQWICDEIDFERGVYVQRVNESTFDGSSDENWYTLVSANGVHYRMLTRACRGLIKTTVTGAKGVILCSAFPARKADETYLSNMGISVEVDGAISVYMPECQTLTDFKAYLSENPMTCLTALANPVETALTAEEIAAFKALRTKESICTIINNAGAYMAAAYVPDSMAAICISKRLSALEDAILSLGGNV